MIKKRLGFVPPDRPADTLIRALVCGGSRAAAPRTFPPDPGARTRLLKLPPFVFDPFLTRTLQIECGGPPFVVIHTILRIYILDSVAVFLCFYDHHFGGPCILTRRQMYFSMTIASEDSLLHKKKLLAAIPPSLAGPLLQHISP